MSVDLSSHRRPAAFTPAFRIYVVAQALACLPFVPAALSDAIQAPYQTLLWIALTAIANLLTIPMLPKINLDSSLGAPVSVASGVLLSPALALLIGLTGFTNERELRREAPLWLSLANRSQYGLSAGAASYAAHAVLRGGDDPVRLVAATVLGVLVFNLVNTLLVTGVASIRYGMRLTDAAKTTSSPVPHYAVDFAFVSLLALLFVVLYRQSGPWSLVLLALPLWLGYRAIREARIAEDRAEELAGRVRELENLNMLGSELLTARTGGEVIMTSRGALRRALDSDQVEASLTGDLPSGLEVVKVRGAEPAAIGVPRDAGEWSVATVEAVASLTGMALRRLGLEHDLAENEKALVRLSGRILEEGNLERNRIAVEIHDDVLPSFAAAGIQADNVRRALAWQEPERAENVAEAMRDALHVGIARLRDVLEALRRQIIVPGSLRSGLAVALADLRLEHGVEGQLHAPETLPSIPLAVEILVLETVRGCLTNVARHAKAHAVVVLLDITGSALRVEVRDDGIGFDPEAVGPGHHGLALMRQRVELARGRFVVGSAMGNGTRVCLEVPV